jgi:hypothetical protein
MKTKDRILSRRSFRSRVAFCMMIGVIALLAQAEPARAGSWASVNPDGTLLKSRGVIANFRDSAGRYRIDAAFHIALIC